MSSVNINSPASNTINNQINLNEVIVVTSDNQINVTQPVTNVVEVVTLGPMGPGGGGGSNVNTGSFATTGSNIFYGNQIISGTSDFILQVHGVNDSPWAFGIYNDTYNPTQSVLAGFIWSDGRAAIGTEVDKPIEIYTNANYFTPTVIISSSGVTVNNTLTITGSQLISGSIILDGLHNYIRFPNGSAVGDIQNIMGGYPDPNGSVDLYAPNKAAWVQMNYDNRNFMYLEDAYGAISIFSGSQGANWNFNFDGTTNFPLGTFTSQSGQTGQALISDGSGNIKWGNITNIDTGSFAITGSNLFTGNQTIDAGSTDGFGSGIKFANQGFAHYTTGISGSTFVIADSSANYYSTWANADIKLQIGETVSSFNTNLKVSGSVEIQGGIDFGVKIGSGDPISLVSDAYILMSSIAGSPAGYTINRGDSTTYASIDLLTTQDVSKGWSIQTQPNSNNLFVLDREGSKNIISATPNNGGISINSDLSVTGSLSVSGSVTADNLWYRWTLSNVPLDIAGQYEIVPITPGYKFVSMKSVEPTSIYNTACQLENNSDTNIVTITAGSFIRLETAAQGNILGKLSSVMLQPNQIITEFELPGGELYMVSLDTESIVVTVDGNASDVYPIDVTITGYLKKI